MSDITADDLQQFLELSKWAEELLMLADGRFGRSPHDEHFRTPIPWTDGRVGSSVAEDLAAIVRELMANAYAFDELAGMFEDKILIAVGTLCDPVHLEWPIHLDCPGQPTTVPFPFRGDSAHSAVGLWAFTLADDLFKCGLSPDDDMSDRPATDPAWGILEAYGPLPDRESDKVSGRLRQERLFLEESKWAKGLLSTRTRTRTAEPPRREKLEAVRAIFLESGKSDLARKRIRAELEKKYVQISDQALTDCLDILREEGLYSVAPRKRTARRS